MPEPGGPRVIGGGNGKGGEVWERLLVWRIPEPRDHLTADVRQFRKGRMVAVDMSPVVNRILVK